MIGGAVTVRFRVDGTPSPQGSKTCYCRGGKAIVVEGRRGPARKAFAAWREAVRIAASQHSLIAGPVAVTLEFELERPPSHLTRAGRLRKGAPLLPAQKRLDIDKLTRAVLDGLTDGGIIEDDGRVVKLRASKVYGDPGVTVTISPVQPAAQVAL